MKISKIYFALYIFIIYNSVNGQEIVRLDSLADTYHFAGNYIEAIQERNKLLSQLKNNKERELQELKLKLSEYYLTSSWEEGLILLEKIHVQATTFKQLPSLYKAEYYDNYYHAIAYASGNWEKSLQVAKTLINEIEEQRIVVDPKKKADVLYDMAYINGELKNHRMAIEYYLNVSLLYTALGMAQSSEMALLYNNLGFEYSRLSNFKNTNEYYALATEIWENEPQNNANYLTTAYNNLIYNLLSYGEIDKADYYWEKLKKAAEQIDPKQLDNYQKVSLSVLLNALKICVFRKETTCFDTYQKLMDYFDKLENKPAYISYYSAANTIILSYLIEAKQLEKAKKIAEASELVLISNNFNEGLLVLYSHIAVINKEIKAYETALAYIDKALNIANKTTKGNQAGLLVSRGVILKEMGNISEAEKYYKEAQEVIDSEQSTDIETLSYYTEIAHFYSQKYQLTKDTKALENAYHLYENCIEKFNTIYKNGLFNAKLVEYLSLIHEGLFAIMIADNSKSIAIINHVENTTSKYLWSNFIKNNSSTQLLQIDKNYTTLQQVNADIAYHKTAIQQKKEQITPDTLTIKELQNKVLDLETKAETLGLKLMKSNPNYVALYDSKFNLGQFIANLQPNETLLSFYPTKANIYAVVITSKGIIKCHKLEDKENLHKTVVDYVSALKNKEEYDKLGNTLYASLLKPIDLEAQQLTIIARGTLATLPFETLRINGSYLVEKVTINYANTLNLYALQKELPVNKTIKLTVFNPDYKGTSFSILPFANQEARFLEATYQAQTFSGMEASKSNFFNNANQSSIYHLAMHAQVNNKDENASKLIFGKDPLYFSELYAQSIPLDLVVLSACETGIGKTQEGEGMMSLSRAFTFSGVAATLHSLWQVPDKQGAEIMQLFYKNIHQGLRKDEALQQAKISFLQYAKADELKHPYYWSGFVLSGNPKALVNSPNYFLYGVLFFGFFILLVLYLKFRK